MATYFIGDIHGCYRELMLLLSKVEFNPSKDVLWSVGDLIARGPDSLEVLAYFEKYHGATNLVLGNHELNLFATVGNIKRARKSDNLGELLESCKLPKYIDWLRTIPLYKEFPNDKLLITHAGVYPKWSLDTIKEEGKLISDMLIAEDYLYSLIAKMYTQDEVSWEHAHKSLTHRILFVVSAFTRMRYLTLDDKLDFMLKCGPNENKTELRPWYKLKSKLGSHKVIFGHWGTLKRDINPKDEQKMNIKCLDSGCCWGDSLTLWHLESDQEISQKAL